MSKSTERLRLGYYLK